MKKLGAIYDQKTQILDILGLENGEENGESIILLIGYNKKQKKNYERSIITVLPTLLYLPYEPDISNDPKNWSEAYIRRLIDKHLEWGRKQRVTQERQFYERFVKENRGNYNFTVRAETFHAPMVRQFFQSVEYLGVRLCERLSIVYKRKGDTTVHIADGYLIDTVLEEENGKVIDEFLTPVFVSDEDEIIVYPENTSLGKLSLSVPLDSQYVTTALAKRTDSKFKKRTTQYEGKDTETGEMVRINEEVRYQGNEDSFVMRVLGNITTLNVEVDTHTSDYIVESTTSDPNLKIIKREDGLTKAYIVHTTQLPYDQKNNVRNVKVTHTVPVSLPYLSNSIVKMISIKIPDDREIRLDKEDYINPRI